MIIYRFNYNLIRYDVGDNIRDNEFLTSYYHNINERAGVDNFLNWLRKLSDDQLNGIGLRKDTYNSEYYMPIIRRYNPYHLQDLLNWLYDLEIIEASFIGFVLSGRKNGMLSTIYTIDADILVIRGESGLLEARWWV